MSNETFKTQKSHEVVKPDVTLEEAISLAVKCYDLNNIEKDQCSELDGYEDRNFYIKLRTGEFVLKVANSTDTANLQVLEHQNALMEYLSKFKLRTQIPLKSVNNRLIESKYFYTRINIKGKMFAAIFVINLIIFLGSMKERMHAVRLLTFIPGEVLSRVVLTEQLVSDVGACVAELHRFFYQLLIQKQHDCDAEWLMQLRGPVLWNLGRLDTLGDYVKLLPLEEDRQLVLDVLSKIRTKVYPISDKFRKGLIHGDLNEGNILVEDNRVIGLLDWQDTQYNYLLYDVAIPIMYLTLVAVKQQLVDVSDKTSLLSVGRLLVKSYQSRALHQRLSSSELFSLPVLVAGRFVQSLCIGERSSQLHPEDVYLRNSLTCGWRILRALCVLQQEEYIQEWKLD